uniref:Uncharacterized protein n=1 Tax=Proboscia inermis TaxID=420281 RepID=A0A7S0GN77_9STRA
MGRSHNAIVDVDAHVRFVIIVCVVVGVGGGLAELGSNIVGAAFTPVTKLTPTPVMGIIFKTEIRMSGWSSADNEGVLFFRKREVAASVGISRTGNVSWRGARRGGE